MEANRKANECAFCGWKRTNVKPINANEGQRREDSQTIEDETVRNEFSQ